MMNTIAKRFLRGAAAAVASALLIYAANALTSSPEANHFLGAAGLAVLTGILLALDKHLRGGNSTP